jgi:pimeloyl-ACP methyl ester carboxylesterase
MIGSALDNVLVTRRIRPEITAQWLPGTSMITTAIGTIRVFDSGGDRSPLIVIPDGPSVIEHYRDVISKLRDRVRVVCMEMPGFGFSFPGPRYDYSVAQGRSAIIGVLDALGIPRATLWASCGNSFYAMSAAEFAPDRIASLVLAQAAALNVMRGWVKRILPWPLRTPLLGQAMCRLQQKKLAVLWYHNALRPGTDVASFRDVALNTMDAGACFCLASASQSLAHADASMLRNLKVPATVVWGKQDRTHRRTQPESIKEHLPGATICVFDDSGHSPDLEQPERFIDIALRQMPAYY